MIFPIGDDDRRLTRPAYVTWALLVLNVLAYFGLQQGEAGVVFTYGWSAIPYELVNGVDLVRGQLMEVQGERITIPQAEGPFPIYMTLVTALFLHGGLFHLGGNLLYLYIFGDNVEHRFGAGRFLVFYLLSGIAATLAQISVDPGSVVPTLGASGAISGVLGAYLVLFPRNKVHVLFLFKVVTLSALWVLGGWIVLQVVQWQQAPAGAVGGVAYAAHIGGFVAGVLSGLVARLRMAKEPDHVFKPYAERDQSRRLW